jgi:hypothetical protein
LQLTEDIDRGSYEMIELAGDRANSQCTTEGIKERIHKEGEVKK